MKEDAFIVTKKDGSKVTCYIMATYNDEDTGKDYIVYTDGSLNEERKLNIFYSMYKREGNNIRLIDITSTADTKIALEVVKELFEKTKEYMKNNNIAPGGNNVQ